MTDRYDNDPAIRITADGGELKYTSGQPLMDEGGLENAVIISLFTAEGWVGNALEIDTDRMIGSPFGEYLTGRPITSGTVREMERAAEDALRWMENIKLADSVRATITIPEPKRINLKIEIIKKGGEAILLRYDLNWVASSEQAPVNTGV